MAPKKKAPQVQTNAGVNPMGPPASSKSIAAAGPVLSRNEAMKIADARNQTTAQVMAAAQNKGVALGAGLVNAFNNGKLGGNTSMGMPVNQGTAKALQQLQALQGLQMNKGTAYAGYSTTNTPAYNHSDLNGNTYIPGSTTYNPIVLPRSVVTGVQRVPAGGKGKTPAAPAAPAEQKVDPYQAWLDSVNASNQAIIDSVNSQIEANASQAQLYMGQIEALMAQMSQAQQQPGGLAALTPYAVTTTSGPADGAKLTTAITARKKPTDTDLSISPLVGSLPGTGLNIAI